MIHAKRGSNVKRVLFGVGAALLILVVASAIFVVNAKLREREIRAYGEDAIVGIVSNWNEQALLQRASPEL